MKNASILSLPLMAAGLFGFGQAAAELKTQAFEYQVNNEAYTGYMAWDDSTQEKRPGVLLVHEWWGHDEFVRDQAEKLARAGYTAMALDMYGSGKKAEHPDEAQAFMKAATSDPQAMKARFTAAMEKLQAHKTVDSESIAAQGYCFGGAVVLNMARAGVDLDGVVSFHGSLGTENPAQSGDISARIQVYTGAADSLVPAEQVAGFVSEMHNANADLMLRSYPGVKHSFTNPAADAKAEEFGMPVGYDQAAAEDAFNGTLAFYRELFGQ